MYRFIAVASVLLAAGCTDRIGQAQDGIDTAGHLACDDCYGAFIIYTSTQACLDAVEDTYGTTEAQADCLRDVVGRDQAAADYYDCINEELGALNDCFRENNQPECDNEAMRECLTDYSEAAQSCADTHLTTAASESIQECVD